MPKSLVRNPHHKRGRTGSCVVRTLMFTCMNFLLWLQQHFRVAMKFSSHFYLDYCVFRVGVEFELAKEQRIFQYEQQKKSSKMKLKQSEV